jgi:spore germination cell wall hydrolase CwlJ-like protein
MKSKKLIYCMLLTIVFTLGTLSSKAYAEETNIPTPVETTENAEIVSENSNNSNEDLTYIEDSETTLDDTKVIDEMEEVIESDESTEEVEEVEEEEVEEEVEEVEEKKSDNKDDKKDTKKTTSDKKETTEKKTVVKEKKNYTNAELRLLSCLIFTEAGNQSYNGKLAVANVVINRAKSNVFWHVNTIKEVIYDSKWGVQFSVIIKGNDGTSPFSRALEMYDQKSYSSEAMKDNMNQSIKAAKAALNGENNIGDYLYFSGNSNYLSNKYSDHKVIGAHIFYNVK